MYWISKIYYWFIYLFFIIYYFFSFSINYFVFSNQVQGNCNICNVTFYSYIWQLLKYSRGINYETWRTSKWTWSVSPEIVSMTKRFKNHIPRWQMFNFNYYVRIMGRPKNILWIRVENFPFIFGMDSREKSWAWNETTTKTHDKSSHATFSQIVSLTLKTKFNNASSNLLFT